MAKGDMAKGAASSKEDDLEMTIKLIMEHVDVEAKRQDAQKIADAEEEKTKKEEERAKRKTFDLPTLIKSEPRPIMLRSSRTNEIIEEYVPEPSSSIATKDSENTLDKVLSKLTSLFPLFVVSSAIIGIKRPVYLTWVNKGQIIPLMLAAV